MMVVAVSKCRSPPNLFPGQTNRHMTAHAGSISQIDPNSMATLGDLETPKSWQAFVKFNVNGCDVKKFRTDA